MAKRAKRIKLSKLEHRIREVLEEHPEGLDINQIRSLAVDPGDPQEHLDRRIRAVRSYYFIRGQQEGLRHVYYCDGLKPEEEWGSSQVSQKDRAHVLHLSHGRCQMCGRTISDDDIKLVVDHKIPQSWGGGKGLDNLWAICADCNSGKKNYFSSFDANIMRAIVKINSVHHRLLKLLELNFQKWVDSDLLEIAANAKEPQQDWHKRLRELRYFGLIIKSRREKRGNRTVSMYMLQNRVENLPDNLTAAARLFERQRAENNRRKKRNNN